MVRLEMSWIAIIALISVSVDGAPILGKSKERLRLTNFTISSIGKFYVINNFGSVDKKDGEAQDNKSLQTSLETLQKQMEALVNQSRENTHEIESFMKMTSSQLQKIENTLKERNISKNTTKGIHEYLAMPRMCIKSIMEQFELLEKLCSSNDSNVCHPPDAACSNTVVTRKSNLDCSLTCASIQNCSGFRYNNESKSCILSIGYCRSSTYGIASAYKAKDCSSITAFSTGLKDGNYRLYPASGPSEGYIFHCHQMNTRTPRTFLTLPKLNSMIYGGNAFRYNPKFLYTNTTYYKIALDLKTLMVNISDRTFSTNISPTNVLDYAVGGACRGSGAPYGQVRVDLEGTIFHIDKAVTTKLYGFNPFMVKGSNFTSNRKKLIMKCGGSCGFCTTSYGGAKKKLKLQFD